MTIKTDIETTVHRICCVLEDKHDIKLIGINGLDCSGKTTLATALFDRLEKAGRMPTLLHVDDFNNKPKQTELYGAYVDGVFGASELDDYYNNSVDYDLLLQALQQARQRGGVTLVEGVFLFKPQLAPLLDLKILLKIPEAIGFERYKGRKNQVGDTRPASVFTDIWVPAYKRYEQECDIEGQADLIFTA